MRNKIRGALMGFAIGDALGATTEFMSEFEIKEKYGKVTEIIGGGAFNVRAGETTDDTAMTLAVADGIVENKKNPIEIIGKNFLDWYDSKPKDVGIIISTVLSIFKENWFQTAKYAHDHFLDGKSAGNGTLMRCLPIALAYTHKDEMDRFTSLQSKMTHYDDLASEACLIYNRIAYRLVNGENLRESIRTEIMGTRYEIVLSEVPSVPADGFVVDTLLWVLHWLLNCDSFTDVAVAATNKGGDSDTIAAIACGLKGLETGYNQLPANFVDPILEKERIIETADAIYMIR